MTLTSFSLLTAFGAGILSFLSPCVVPLVPGYLSYLADTGLAQVPGQAAVRWRVSRHALWFVLGTVIFVTLLGVVAALLSTALSTYQQVLERASGVLLMLFGIALTGLVPLPWLSGDHRVRVKPGRSAWWRSGLLGLTFGAGWSVCSTPLLGAVLVLTAASSLSPLQAISIMLAFGLGQGVPFLLAGLLVDRAGPFLRRIPRVTSILTMIGGVTLILLGFFLVTGLFSTTA
jgi:cytochrome c-type biogenesis protein